MANEAENQQYMLVSNINYNKLNGREREKMRKNWIFAATTTADATAHTLLFLEFSSALVFIIDPTTWCSLVFSFPFFPLFNCYVCTN